MLALEAPAHFFHVLKVVEGFVYVIDLCLYMTWKPLGNHIGMCADFFRFCPI